MVHINDLPTEMLARIFRILYWNTHDPRYMHYPSRACVLWRDILMATPFYWDHLFLDVAQDPTPFLDTIGLYGAPGVNIEIKNSSKRDETNITEQKRIEKHRVSQIYCRMISHLGVFTRISIEVLYQSSLPSCADILTRGHLPYLSQIYFKCSVNDLDEDSCIIRQDILTRKDINDPLFSSLTQLRLPGYLFMELSQLGTDWISRFQCSSTAFHIHICHLIFAKSDHDNPKANSFHDLMGALMLGGKRLTFLTLEDVSAHLSMTPIHDKISLSTERLYLYGVSPTFSSPFFSSIAFPEDHSLSELVFFNCIIPSIVTDTSFELQKLSVYEIPSSPQHIPDSNTETDDVSLINAITAFPPTRMSIKECNNITDAFFNWLSMDENRGATRHLTSLKLYMCVGHNFTSGSVRKFVEEHQRQAQEYPNEVSELDYVGIKSFYGPPVDKEDALWFMDDARNQTCVEWEAYFEEYDEQFEEGGFPSLDIAREILLGSAEE